MTIIKAFHIHESEGEDHLLYATVCTMQWLVLIITYDVVYVSQYDNIDAEHKLIFEAIFNCIKDPKSAALITKLYDVTADHFTDEEVRIVYIV